MLPSALALFPSHIVSHTCSGNDLSCSDLTVPESGDNAVVFYPRVNISQVRSFVT